MEKEIVIKIDEKAFQSVINICKDGAGDIFHKAIANGIPLPKGHGRLIDADELYDGFIDGTEGYDCQTWNRIEIGDIIEDVPTIIEADKEGENEADS